MNILIPNPTQELETVDAIDLGTVITLANDLKEKLNEVIRQLNLVIDGLNALVGEE